MVPLVSSEVSAMSLNTAASVLVILLLSQPVVRGHTDWGVTYSSHQIWSSKGSTVDIPCTYTYPPRIDELDTKVQETLWFTELNGNQSVDLRSEPDYSGRVEYLLKQNDCTLRIRDLRDTDSAEYKFRFTTNQQGGRFTGSPGVTLTVTDLQVKVKRSSGYEDDGSAAVYAPKIFSVSVNPAGEIRESSRVTVTCSSDGYPTPEYTWYQRNGHEYEPLSEGSELVFSSIQPSDSGYYFCGATNEAGGSKAFVGVFLVVKYAPKLPSVSVSPSAEIMEGGSVTLSCSSDANPAASYTWYKEDEDSPEASGEIFTIAEFRAEHSGSYSCEAENVFGRQRSASRLVVVAGTALKIHLLRLTVVLLVMTPLLLLTLWMRKKKKETQSSTTGPNEPAEMMELNSSPEEVSAVPAAQTEDTEEQEVQRGEENRRTSDSWSLV